MTCSKASAPVIHVETPYGLAEAVKPSKHHPWMAHFPWGSECYYGTCEDVREKMEQAVTNYFAGRNTD